MILSLKTSSAAVDSQSDAIPFLGAGYLKALDDAIATIDRIAFPIDTNDSKFS